MMSIVDGLSAKVAKDPGLTKKSVARFDLGLLLFNQRDAINRLWKAADKVARTRDDAALPELAAAVDELRPYFGERP